MFHLRERASVSFAAYCRVYNSSRSPNLQTLRRFDIGPVPAINNPISVRHQILAGKRFIITHNIDVRMRRKNKMFFIKIIRKSLQTMYQSNLRVLFLFPAVLYLEKTFHFLTDFISDKCWTPIVCDSR